MYFVNARYSEFELRMRASPMHQVCDAMKSSTHITSKHRSYAQKDRSLTDSADKLAAAIQVGVYDDHADHTSTV